MQCKCFLLFLFIIVLWFFSAGTPIVLQPLFFFSFPASADATFQKPCVNWQPTNTTDTISHRQAANLNTIHTHTHRRSTQTETSSHWVVQQSWPCFHAAESLKVQDGLPVFWLSTACVFHTTRSKQNSVFLSLCIFFSKLAISLRCFIAVNA